MDIDRILGEWGGWAGRDGSSSVPVCSLEGADGGGVEWLDAPPHGEAAPSDPCYDGTRALLLASPVVPASSLIAPVQICFSEGCPLPLGWMLLDWNELAHSGNVKLIVWSVAPAGLPCLSAGSPRALLPRLAAGGRSRREWRLPLCGWEGLRGLF